MLQFLLAPKSTLVRWTGAVTVSVSLLLSSGCATSRNVPQINAHYYGQCVRPLERMQEADRRLMKTTAQSALGGALAGAVIGLIVTASDPYALPAGLLVGLAGGAVVGGGVGYTYAKLSQIADEDTRFASIRVTANQDLSRANRLQLYSYECMLCYMQEFESLKRAYESGSMLKEEYRARFQEIMTAMKALGQIIGAMDKDIARTEREFAASFSKSSPQQPVAAQKPAPKPRVDRASRRNFTANLSASRMRVQRARQRNDEDLTRMLSEFSGKVTPPRQNPAKIQADYGAGYSETRQEIEDLRATHHEAIAIMEDAAIEAGIDMV